MCPLDLVNPGGGFYPGPNILNATPMFDISNLMASCQKVFLFLLSMILAYSTDMGISMPYFCVAFLTLVLVLAIIESLFLSVQGTHYANVGSSCMPLAVAYTAISTGLDTLKSLRGTHVIVQPFHLTRNFYPTVVCLLGRHPLLNVIHWFSLLTALPSLE